MLRTILLAGTVALAAPVLAQNVGTAAQVNTPAGSANVSGAATLPSDTHMSTPRDRAAPPAGQQLDTTGGVAVAVTPGQNEAAATATAAQTGAVTGTSPAEAAAVQETAAEAMAPTGVPAAYGAGASAQSLVGGGAAAQSQNYPRCSRTVRDSCIQRGGR